MLDLSPNELTFTLIIHVITTLNRKPDAAFYSQMKLSFAVLEFLQDHIEQLKNNIEKYSNLRQLLENLRSYIDDTNDGNIVIDRLTKILKSVTTIHDFITLVEKIREIFNIDSSQNLNECPGPIKICNDSYLGVFVRTFLVKWDCLEFENHCKFYENVTSFVHDNNLSNNSHESELDLFEYKLGTDDIYSMYDTYQSKPTDNKYSSKSNQSLLGPKEYFINSQKSLLNQDVSVTEDFIHKYFDYNGNNLLYRFGSNFDNKSDNNSKSANKNYLQLLLSSLTQSLDLSKFSSSRHQQAMISLATMWTNVGNHNMAMSAVEEAMKTAHQKGDHTTVARALLLIHYIFKSTQNNELLSSAEDILIRGLERCCSLKLNKLVYEMSLLLVQIRLINSWRPFINNNSYNNNNDNTSEHSINDHIRWSCGDLLMQLNVTLYGDIDLIKTCVSGEYGSTQGHPKTDKSNKLNTGINNMMMLNNNKSSLESELPSCHSPETIELSINCALTASEIWMRQGMIKEAILTLKRTFLQFATHAYAIDYVRLLSTLLRLQVDNICKSYNNDMIFLGLNNQNKSYLFDKNNSKRGYDKVWLVYEELKSSFPSQYPPIISQMIGYLRLYILIHYAIIDGNMNKASRLALSLIEISNTGIIELERDERKFYSMENLRARMLYGKILNSFNQNESEELFLSVEKIAKKIGYKLIEFEAQVYRLLFEYSNSLASHALGLDTEQEADKSLKSIYKILNLSKQNNFYYIEILISRSIGFLSKLNI
eukprot:gene7881-10697_t